MRQDERETLRRLQFRCGYCGVSERDAGAELTVDHFQPRSQGGVRERENWVYCCHACNEIKGDFWQPNATHRLLHPLRDDVAAHMVEQEDGTPQARSQTRAFHIGQDEPSRLLEAPATFIMRSPNAAAASGASAPSTLWSSRSA